MAGRPKEELVCWDPAHWQGGVHHGVCSVYVSRALENNLRSAGRLGLVAGTQSEAGPWKPTCGQSAKGPGMLSVHVGRAK